jgi:hypothetical protein
MNHPSETHEVRDENYTRTLTRAADFLPLVVGKSGRQKRKNNNVFANDLRLSPEFAFLRYEISYCRLAALAGTNRAGYGRCTPYR